MLNDKELSEYQELRASQGLPEISGQDALVEAQALVNFISLSINK